MLELVEQLVSVINEELALYYRLQHSLEQEFLALNQGTIAELEAALQQKSELIQSLTVSYQQRQRLIHSHSVVAGQSADHILSLYANPKDLAVWQQLLDVAGSAQESNRINGLLIQQLGLQNQKALAILQGTTANETNLYDPKGQNQISRPSRTIVS